MSGKLQNEPSINISSNGAWDMHIRKLLDNGRRRVNQLCKVINPRRACAERVTVVVSCVCVCVCLYVCLSEHAILAVRAIRSITKYAIVLSVRFAAILKKRFS